jgi:hypothetical protein
LSITSQIAFLPSGSINQSVVAQRLSQSSCRCRRDSRTGGGGGGGGGSDSGEAVLLYYLLLLLPMSLLLSYRIAEAPGAIPGTHSSFGALDIEADQKMRRTQTCRRIHPSTSKNFVFLFEASNF